MSLPLSTLMHPSWAKALAPVEHVVNTIDDRLCATGQPFLPAGHNVLRAFSRPLEQTRVLVLGQDPYPTPGHAVGLSFSVDRDVRPIPRSLQNIYTELKSDLGIEPAKHGDLTRWFEQGVMLLNRVLTVEPHKPASHRGIGWEAVTEQAIKALIEASAAGQPLTAVLWGRDARNLAPMLRQANVGVVESPHPSPLSASRGFFESKPFSKVDGMLQAQGATAIDWRL